jgi:capsular polysaccharide transport system permease protein
LNEIAKTSEVSQPRLLARLASLTRPKRETRAVRVASPVSGGTKQKRRSGRIGAIASFVLLVVLPAVAVWVYFLALASDQFEVETRFVVRNAEPISSPSPIETGRQGTEGSLSAPVANPSSSAEQNPHLVRSYILSPAAIADVSRDVDLVAMFSRPGIDFVYRLPADPSSDALARYWLSQVQAFVNPQSLVVTVQVRAFLPQDALAISESIIKRSEALVDQISQRSRADAVRFAEEDLARADERLRAALLALRELRDRDGILSPVQAAEDTAKLLAQLLGNRITIESELFVVRRTLAANAPSVVTLTRQLESVDRQIAQIRSQLTGTSDLANTLSAALARFEGLEVERLLAERLYTISQNGLVRARQNAERQSVFISLFVPPRLPVEASRPRRIGMSLAFTMALFMAWSVMALIVASVRDHQR